VLRIEFNPPDDPTLSGRIERLDDGGDGDSVERASVNAAELIDKQAMFGGHGRRHDEMQGGRDQRTNH
jgi:hypothetical protein